MKSAAIDAAEWDKKYPRVMRLLIKRSLHRDYVYRALKESLEAYQSLEDYRRANQMLTDEVAKLQRACVDLAMHASEVKLELYKLKRETGNL